MESVSVTGGPDKRFEVERVRTWESGHPGSDPGLGDSRHTNPPFWTRPTKVLVLLKEWENSYWAQSLLLWVVEGQFQREP